ncbi:MAG: hypothetical protein PUG13_01220 [Streptococcus hyointestinalis]|nr:hypothetical protein [Streptococcus hyointestinalis]MDD6384027.1 hypothetical protein [Streptococcus hyointestinalis]
MNTIIVNDKLVSVPAETVLYYLSYRKLSKELENGYSDGLKEALDNHAKNIMRWANDQEGLWVALPELIPSFEKLVSDYI